ncbi:hypothetical protein VCCP10303_2249, partial [Vibrio cholerae CP1030(3)]
MGWAFKPFCARKRLIYRNRRLLKQSRIDRR